MILYLNFNHVLVENLSSIYSSIHLGNKEKISTLLEKSYLSNEQKTCLCIYGRIKELSQNSASGTSELELQKITNPTAKKIMIMIANEEFDLSEEKVVDEYLQLFEINEFTLDHIKFLYSELLRFNALHLLRKMEYTSAIDYFREAIGWKQEIFDDHGIGIINNQLGVVMIGQGNLEEAIKLFNQAKTVFRTFHDYNNLGLVHNNMGGLFFSRGNIEIAKSHYSAGLEFARKVNDQRLKGKLLNNLGIIHFERAEFNKALDYYEQSLHYKEVNNETSGIPPTLHNIGKIHGKQGDYFLAIKYLERSLAQCPEDDPILKANTLSELINFHTILQEFDKARSYLLELGTLNDSLDLPIAKQFYLLSEALILKSSDLTGYMIDSTKNLETIIEGPILHIEITKTAILNYIELKLERLQRPSQHKLKEIREYLYMLYKLTQEHSSKYDLIESMLLFSRYSRLIGDDTKSRQLNFQAVLMSYEHDFPSLIKKSEKMSEDTISEISKETELREFKAELISI